MNARPTAHPSVEVLRAFILGKASVVPAEVVVAHLENCPDCRKVVEGMSGDSFADRVKQAQPTASLPTPDPQAATRDSVPDLPALPPIDVPPELARHPDYELKRKLGRGGMGVVYLARNKLMDRLEALKVINEKSLGHDGATERFLQEIRSAAKLQHPNVVTAYAAARLGDLLMLAMEYVDGMNLQELVRQKGPLPVAHACHYARQAALGLQQALEQGLVHRDIKPNNLILGRKSVVKILDFGLAKVRQEEGNPGLTSANVMMGTLDYLAPEQATDARNADIRADIYSLGCTLYFLLTSRPPFVVQNPAEAIAAHSLRQPESVNQVRPDVPAGLAAVVARMLAKKPAERFQTPDEVARALVPFIKGDEAESPRPEPDSTVPQPPPVRPKAVMTKPPSSGRKVGLKVAVVSAGLLVILGLVWFRPFTEVPKLQAPEWKPQAPDREPRPGEVGILSLGPSFEMKFAWIPPGTFQMGSEMGNTDEKPVHRVTLTKGFYMGIYPVTQSQWQAVMNHNPSSQYSRGDDGPVDMVSWDDCQKFCKKLNGLTDKPIRLPTEAEWEYACRAGTTTEYYSGNGEDALRKVGWRAVKYDPKISPVGKLAPNAWGLYDMHGNVGQWCQDWYGPYSKENKIDPKGSSNGDTRVLRGGSTMHSPSDCRAASRIRYVPAYRVLCCGCRVCFFLE